MSFTERQIVRMLRAGLSPVEVIVAIESGAHLSYKEAAEPRRRTDRETARAA